MDVNNSVYMLHARTQPKQSPTYGSGSHKSMSMWTRRSWTSPWQNTSKGSRFWSRSQRRGRPWQWTSLAAGVDIFSDTPSQSTSQSNCNVGLTVMDTLLTLDSNEPVNSVCPLLMNRVFFFFLFTLSVLPHTSLITSIDQKLVQKLKVALSSKTLPESQETQRLTTARHRPCLSQLNPDHILLPSYAQVCK